MTKLILVVLVVACSTVVFANADDPLAVGVFGTAEGQEIAGGFLFVDGKYIEPPYHVSSRGVQVSVHGVWSERVADWPPPDLSQPEMPKLPDGISKSNTIYDFRSGGKWPDYIPRMIRYHRQNTPQDQVIAKIIEAYAALPFVSKVQHIEGERIDVTTSDGKVHHVMLASAGRDYFLNPLTQEEVAARIRQTRERYEGVFRSGGALLVFSDGATQAVTPGLVRRDFAILARIAGGGMPLDRKIAELNRLEVLNAYDSPYWRSFVEHFQVSSGFAQRIASFGDPIELQLRRERAVEADIEYRRKIDQEAEKLRRLATEAP